MKRTTVNSKLVWINFLAAVEDTVRNTKLDSVPGLCNTVILHKSIYWFGGNRRSITLEIRVLTWLTGEFMLSICWQNDLVIPLSWVQQTAQSRRLRSWRTLTRILDGKEADLTTPPILLPHQSLNSSGNICRMGQKGWKRSDFFLTQWCCNSPFTQARPDMPGRNLFRSLVAMTEQVLQEDHSVGGLY